MAATWKRARELYDRCSIGRTLLRRSSEAMASRLTERILHVLNIRDAENPFTLVAELKANEPTNVKGTEPEGDFERISDLERMIDMAGARGKPLFANIHLMGTHGGQFHPRRRVFSSEQKQVFYWMKNFYDDSVLEFDFLVETAVAMLERKGDLRQDATHRQL